MKKVSWIFKGGWFLGGLAILYQIIILLGIGDYPNYSDIVFTTSTQMLAYFISAILGIFLIAVTTVGYMISRRRAEMTSK